MSVIILYLTRLIYVFIFLADDCQNYQTLSDAERKQTYSSEYPYQCDSSLSVGWYRFQGAAGTKMAISCPPANRCDASFPGWLNGAHPTVDDGIVTRSACIHKAGNCCSSGFSIQVKNCGSYYIYRLIPLTNCDSRYCGTD